MRMFTLVVVVVVRVEDKGSEKKNNRLDAILFVIRAHLFLFVCSLRVY